MEKTPHYDSYVKILEEELIPAMGCTEPIAIALAAAKARETLGSMPLACRVEVSGNIIKNVKAVTVPNTGGLKGIEAAAAAGSDARMSGCELPVVIVSGSGNQGMTTSLPVIEYARDMGADEDALIRALVVADLVTIHQKTGIGRLSAFCGAVSAGCGAASGVAYLKGGRYREVAHTIANALAICSGMICDGAKPSCAAKIAAAVDAGLMGYHMFMSGHQFVDGEGIIKKGVENTIGNVGRLAREGMRRTDEEILHIMVGQ